jgi:hypothetical protein
MMHRVRRQLGSRLAGLGLLALQASFVAAGCTAEIAGGGGGQSSGEGVPPGPGSASAGTSSTGVDPDPALGPFSPAAGSFKRLTKTEFENSLKALLGPVTIGEVEPDTFTGGFAKLGGSTVSISLSGVEKYQGAIEAATAEVFADPERRNALVGCVPMGDSDTACFRSFVERFGRLAWRRALTPEQIERETALAQALAQTLGNAADGLRATTNAILLSPYFLYRLERGEPQAGANFWRYSGYELASRLAFFLSNRAPDAKLLEAAEHGTLDTVEGARAEAERILLTDAGRDSVGNFASELFRVAIIGSRAKDAGLFPQYTPALKTAMMREVPSMLQDLVFDQSAPATDLFTTRTTFVNAELASLYGLDATGLTSDSWVKVTLPANGLRAGYLGTGAFLSQFANQQEGSPTQRGKFMRAALLCQVIPEPPPDVSPTFDDEGQTTPLTKRQKLAKHREKGSTCAGCHSLMDPLGLPLENFDAIGAFRETDAGLPLDVSGDLDGVAFNGPIELGQALSQSDKVAACMVRHLYRYATGVLEAKEQEPLIAQLSTRFQADGRDMKTLMLELVSSDGFRYVAPAL